MPNITIEEVRQKYPEYNHLSDQVLADKLHQKFYPQLSQEDFYNRVGLNVVPKTMVEKIANNPVTNTVLGFGDAIQHQLANIGELASGVSNLPKAHSSEGTAYNVGEFLGNTGAFIGGGELLGGARLASEGLPLVGKIAQILGKTPGALSRVAGSSAYGALNEPEDRLKGAGYGAAFGAAGESLPYAGKAIGSLFEQFKPQKLSEKIIDYLGNGNSLEENAKLLASKVTNLYNSKKIEAKKIYDPIFKHSNLGGDVVYPTINKSGYHSVSTVPEFDFTGAPSAIKELYGTVKKHPSLQNTHDLQSDIGNEIRRLQDIQKKSGLNSEEDDLLKSYVNARQRMKSDISSTIKQRAPELEGEYNKATDYYRENLEPYLNNTKIRELAKQKVINPENVHNIFKNPEPGIEKVAEDLGEEGKNQIIYSAIGHNKKTVTPEKIASSISQLDKRGLESYMTPDLSKYMKSLGGKMRNRDLAQSLFSSIAGSQAGKLIGGQAGEVGGAILGASKGSDLMKFIQPHLPQSDLSQSLMEYLKKGYTPLSQSVIGNVLSNGGQENGT